MRRILSGATRRDFYSLRINIHSSPTYPSLGRNAQLGGTGHTTFASRRKKGEIYRTQSRTYAAPYSHPPEQNRNTSPNLLLRHNNIPKICQHIHQKNILHIVPNVPRPSKRSRDNARCDEGELHRHLRRFFFPFHECDAPRVAQPRCARPFDSSGSFDAGIVCRPAESKSLNTHSPSRISERYGIAGGCSILVTID